jgi:hypothetical protein
MNAANSVEDRDGWESCELEEHVEEVRSRDEELSRLLTERPFDSQVLDAVWLQVEAVRELLDHCGGLHEANVLVRTMES